MVKKNRENGFESFTKWKKIVPKEFLTPSEARKC